MKKTEITTKVIYNPHAGAKKKLLPFHPTITLEDIKTLLEQHQIPVEYAPTKGPGHATKLAEECVKKGYRTILVAGGDGTVGEVMSALINTDVSLGILPLGSFMNLARMLSIPRELEDAVKIIKIGRRRKIDVGCITQLDGESLAHPAYFIEEAGVGIEAELHYYLTNIFDKKIYESIFQIPKAIRRFYGHKVKIYMDDDKMETSATMIRIANAPYGGAALRYTPGAKLNDHQLTISLLRMNRLELSKYFLELLFKKTAHTTKIERKQAHTVKILTDNDTQQRFVHADARVFGTTPVQIKVVPSALSIITGFPTKEEKTKSKRTLLDP